MIWRNPHPCARRAGGVKLAACSRSRCDRDAIARRCSRRGKVMMMSTTPSAPIAPRDAAADFSLAVGGPLFQALRRGRLIDDALGLTQRRIAAFVAICWLPLLLLSALEGRLIGGAIALPFLHDVEVHLRFLVALPLLILAEPVVHKRLRPLVATFTERGLIPDDAMPRFEAALGSALRLRNSTLIELLLIGLVYAVGVQVIWRQYIALDIASWYATPAADGRRYSWAGLWFGLVSMPILQFLLCRWYFRIVLWLRFLWQVSRLPLVLMPAHPDRVAGLGFLSDSIGGFALLGAAHGALLAGMLGDRVLFMHLPLSEFAIHAGVVAGFVLLLAILPLLAFAPQLVQARRIGLRQYDSLAERYVRAFDAKWLHGAAPPGEALIGSADIQSLADIGNSLEVIRGMRVAPILRQDVLLLVLATVLPVAPLMLTVMPLKDLLKLLMGMLV